MCVWTTDAVHKKVTLHQDKILNKNALYIHLPNAEYKVSVQFSAVIFRVA